MHVNLQQSDPVRVPSGHQRVNLDLRFSLDQPAHDKSESQFLGAILIPTSPRRGKELVFPFIVPLTDGPLVID
jgi:hypothetical protein